MAHLPGGIAHAWIQWLLRSKGLTAKSLMDLPDSRLRQYQSLIHRLLASPVFKREEEMLSRMYGDTFSVKE